VSGCGSGPVCMFIMKCSRSVKFKLRIQLHLQNQNMTIKRSKHARKIKGLFTVLLLKYFIKVRLSFQILSTQTKIWPIVLITSSVKGIKYTGWVHFQPLITGYAIGRRILHVHDRYN